MTLRAKWQPRPAGAGLLAPPPAAAAAAAGDADLPGRLGDPGDRRLPAAAASAAAAAARARLTAAI